MDFYRHWYNIEDIRMNMLNNLASLGFYDASTNQIYTGDMNSSDSSYLNKCPLDLYWYKDTDHKVTLHRGDYTDGGKKGIDYKFWSSDSKYHPSGHPYKCGEDWSFFQNYKYYVNRPVDSSNDALGLNMFFMNLKDKGFLLNINATSNTNSPAWNEFIVPTFKLKVCTKNTNDFLWRNVGLDHDYGTDNHGFIKTLIGLPSTNESILSKYLYIYSSYRLNSDQYVRRSSYNNTDIDDLTPYFDLQTGNMVASKLFTMYKKYHYQESNTPVNSKYNMNFIPNVCILSKVPYDNGFIDNLYYMTTCPTASISNDNYTGIFFSFNGRNFINIYGNMVLELPSY